MIDHRSRLLRDEKKSRKKNREVENGLAPGNENDATKDHTQGHAQDRGQGHVIGIDAGDIGDNTVYIRGGISNRL